jgi:hypothetical protein
MKVYLVEVGPCGWVVFVISVLAMDPFDALQTARRHSPEGMTGLSTERKPQGEAWRQKCRRVGHDAGPKPFDSLCRRCGAEL